MDELESVEPSEVEGVRACPFCGDTKVYVWKLGEKFFVSCRSCAAEGPWVKSGPQAAVRRWSERWNEDRRKMETLAVVYLAGDYSEEDVIEDIKISKFSILAAANHFAAALLAPAGIERRIADFPFLVDVPDDARTLLPFTVYERVVNRNERWTHCRSSPDVAGTTASVDSPVEYEAWTQVGGRLQKLVIHPRLLALGQAGPGIGVEVEVYEVVPGSAREGKILEKAGSRRKVAFTGYGQGCELDRSLIGAADRVVVRLAPSEPTRVFSTDLLVLLREEMP